MLVNSTTDTVTTGTMQVPHPNGWEQSCSKQCNTALIFSVRQKTDTKLIFIIPPHRPRSKLSFPLILSHV
jgi:hypothetical protein